MQEQEFAYSGAKEHDVAVREAPGNNAEFSSTRLVEQPTAITAINVLVCLYR